MNESHWMIPPIILDETAFFAIVAFSIAAQSVLCVVLIMSFDVEYK